MGDLSTKTLSLFLVLLFALGAAGFFAGWTYKDSLDNQPEKLIRDLRSTAGNLEEENKQLRTQLAEKTEELKQQEEETQQLVRKLERKLEESRVESADGVVTVSIPNRILFDEASADISRDNRKVLRKVSTTLKEHPNREIRIQGHSDTKPVHPEADFESNWELSAHRAVNVLKYLVYGQGIDRTRIGAVGFGQFRPVTEELSDEAQAKNRRVEIVLYPEEMAPEKK